MADIDKGVGRPGSDEPDLGGLDEDILTADLEADLVDDLGDDGLGEDALGDSDGSAEEDESEESEDRSGDDDGDGFGGSTFSGGFGDESFLGGTAGTDGSGFSSSSPDSFDFDGAGADSFDFGDFDEAGDGADRTGSLGSSHGRSGPSDGGTSAGAGAAGSKGSSGSSGKSDGDHGGHGGGHGEGGSISPSSVASTSVVTEPFDLPRRPHETMASNTQTARTWTAAGAGASCAPAGGSLPRPARGRLFLGRIGGFAATLIIGCAVLFAYPRGIAEANEALAKTPEATYSEYQIKAAFIYIFAKFTRWPARAYADPDAPLRICVFGQDSFGRVLDAIAGKRVGDRHVAVEHLARLADVDRCQMLFVGESKRHDLPAVVAYLGDRPILTVADKPGFARANGMIGMRTVAGKVRFRINLGAARRVGFRFSTRLLDLAEACIARPYLGKAGKKRIFLLCSRRKYGLSASAGS